MTEHVKYAEVTIPALNIERRQAKLVEKAPKRFNIWWNSHYDDKNQIMYTDEDVNVPNEMVIIER
jgi:hypothetical protein